MVVAFRGVGFVVVEYVSEELFRLERKASSFARIIASCWVRTLMLLMFAVFPWITQLSGS
jgi:hypothetical protein